MCSGSGGPLAYFSQHVGWRRSWDIIIPGNFGGDSRTDLLFYDRASGHGEFYTSDGNGNIIQLGPTHNWRKTWTHIIPGSFNGDNLTDLLFYDDPQGIVFGQYEFYATDGSGNINQIGTRKITRQVWDIVVPGGFGGDSRTDLLIYTRAQGAAVFYTVDSVCNLVLLGALHTGWRTTWSSIIPGNFDFSFGSELLFYDLAAGHGEFYTTDYAGGITMLGVTQSWRNSWDMIVPGDFGGTASWYTDLFFYEH